MTWRGMNARTTEVDSTPGVSAEQRNARMRVDGELQRRWGMIPSGLPRQSGRILNIAAAGSGNFLTFGVAGGEVYGTSPLPDPPVDGPKRKKPVVVVGNPIAPVVNSISAVPPGPLSAPVGVVTFTAVITYDGLSGPLLYSWDYLGGGPGFPVPLVVNANPGTFDFDGFCVGPASYWIRLTVTTTGGPPFTANNDYFYFVA